jgi:5-oxoprolinase (ATP-hydrolysing) subunit A
VTTIDLNCDLGEGVGDDAAILPHLTSASIACGLHAGGPSIMRETVEQAARLGVAVGAHPGFADRDRFGRVELPLSPEEIYDLVAYQIGALWPFVRAAGIALRHVKPHGALYHLAARRAEVAGAIARAARETAGLVTFVGAPASPMAAAAADHGLLFAGEGFADRTYAADGTLLPRSDPRALVDGDDAVVADRAVTMVRDGQVPAVDGGALPLSIQTLCLHGDDARAAGRARAIRAALAAAGIAVAAPDAGIR